MKKMFRKSAAVLSTALIASVLAVPSFTAFAESSWPNLYDNSNIIKVKKEIVVTSDNDGATVLAPEAQYLYTVAPDSFETAPTVTDKDNVEKKVKPGVSDAVIIGTDKTAAFGSSASDDAKSVTISDGKGKFVDTFDLEIVPANFNEAGIYRYVITETAPDNLDELGVIHDADNNKRYVDVYVRINDSGDSEVYGTVIFDEDGSITTDTQKTEGFVDETKDFDGDPTETGNADQYPLSNYIVEKAIVSDTKTKEFTFTIIVTGTSGQTFNYSVNTGDDNQQSITNGSATVTADLCDGEYITLKDLPYNVKLSVSEKNAAANTVEYNVTATDGQTNIDLGSTVLQADTTSSVGFAAAMPIASLNDDGTITQLLSHTVFTNTYEEISPTGLLFTAAPFAALAGVGTLFAGLFIKNKKREDSNDMI